MTGEHDEITTLGALAEPSRRALYDHVVAQHDAVSREQAAEAVRIPLHSAKFHLDRLVDEGLLEVEFRRLSGRTGPGAGRPSKLYRRADREVSVSLPPRRYDLAGAILAAAIERAERDGGDLTAAVASAAGDTGRAMATTQGSPRPPLDQVSTLATLLAGHGYEPVPAEDGSLGLANCPFDQLARTHTALVCGMNQALVEGAIEGLGCTGLEARLEPSPDHCCVRARPRPTL